MARNVCILSQNTGPNTDMAITALTIIRITPSTRIMARKRRMEIMAMIMERRRITPVTDINFNEAFESIGRFFVLGRWSKVDKHR